ncbi:hypothetical protein BH23PLA1_BH23PLA1_24430 [soil metagenome]
MPQSRVRFIGSRELHRDLPKVLDTLEDPSSRYVLTIHSKPRAVLIGTDAFLELLRGYTPADRLLAMQLGALVKGLEAAGGAETDRPAPVSEPTPEPLAQGQTETEPQLVTI